MQTNKPTRECLRIVIENAPKRFLDLRESFMRHLLRLNAASWFIGGCPDELHWKAAKKPNPPLPHPGNWDRHLIIMHAAIPTSMWYDIDVLIPLAYQPLLCAARFFRPECHYLTADRSGVLAWGMYNSKGTGGMGGHFALNLQAILLLSEPRASNEKGDLRRRWKYEKKRKTPMFEKEKTPWHFTSTMVTENGSKLAYKHTKNEKAHKCE